MSRSRRVPVRDWMSYRDGRSVVLVAGPLELTAEQLEAGLVARAQRSPDYFGLQSFDPVKQRLTFPAKAEYGERARQLLNVDSRPMDDPTEWAAELGRSADPDTLVAWSFRDGFVGYQFSHMIADGRSGTRAFVEVLLLAQDQLVEISASSRQRLPVGRAAIRTYLRNPRGLSHVLEIARPKPKSDPDSSTASRTALDSSLPIPRHALMQPDQTQALEAWCAAQVPKVRLPAALASGLCSALVAEGFALDPRAPYLIWDIRRYAGTTQLDTTNLVGGVALGVADPTDPQQVGQAIREATASAQPLAGAVTEAVFGWRDRRHDYGKPPELDTKRAVPDANAPLMPSLSMMTDSLVDRLRWTASPTERTYVAFINTCSPTAVAFFAASVGAAVHLTAVCRPEVFDPDRVQQAMTQFASDPIGFVTT